jgi:tricorn protease
VLRSPLGILALVVRFPLAAAGAFTVLIPPREAAAQAQPPYLFQNPALSATQICFTFAGNIWIASRAGGVAHRLTGSVPGPDDDCAFSPDGRWIAYTNADNGNRDVYVIAVSGGTPRRLSWHPADDIVRGWTPDGKVVFESPRQGIMLTWEPGIPRLFAQGVDEVAPTAIDLPEAWDGAYSPDGRRLAYLPYAPANEAWKRYRGGRTTPIWIANLADAAIERIPRTNSNDQHPMWVGDTVFFISDRDGAAALYAYDVRSKQVTRRIDNHGLDIKSASAGPGGIVYEQFGAVHLFNLTTGKDSALAITPGGELSATLPHFVSVGEQLQHAAISPTGSRAAFEGRGEIITVPAKKGDARDITNTTGATERYPAWSPDGQTIAYFSDRGGAYHLELRPQHGMSDARSITLGGDDTYYYSPTWSPDGKLIGYSTTRGEIWYVDVASGKTTKVDTDPLGDQSSIPLSWSPDSKWLAYPRNIANRLGAVFVYDVAKAGATQVTDGMSAAGWPAFDASGKYLYFLASTDAGPASDFSMMTYDHPITRSLYAIVLRKDLPSPLAPESDEEKAKADSTARDTTKSKAGATPAPITIDFDAIDQRTIALPPPPRNYVALLPGKTGIVMLAEAPLVPVDQQTGPGSVTLYKFDLSERKTDQLLDGVGEFDVSRDGEKILYQQKAAWAIAALSTPIKPGEGVLATGDIQVATDPRAEWQDMYHEAFRLQRAFFYDPSYHGLDLAATERFYARYIDGLGGRPDLDYLLKEALGNLTVGHLFVFSAGAGPGKAPANGLLGADYAADQGRWRFAKVYAGESWNPDLRAPLTQPGVNIRAGEYLLAVNGRDIRSAESVDRALEGMAGKQTVLRVGPNASGSGARDVTVVPVANDLMLRHLAWIDANRRTVDRLSGGKVAYVYVPNTANQGYTRFNRYFFAQQDKLGAVVDERGNRGGNIADYMIEYLRRSEPFNLVTSRWGADVPIPAGAIYGPKVMLINENAGSGGDELPWLFRRFKVGPLVGTRTWGGLVGIGGYPTLMDGAFVTAPRVALWASEGVYAVENVGVSPDVEVELDPASWRAGHDPQLERAVTIVMDSLAKNPPKTFARPAFPTWAKGTQLPTP